MEDVSDHTTKFTPLLFITTAGLQETVDFKDAFEKVQSSSKQEGEILGAKIDGSYKDYINILKKIFRS